MQEISVNSSKPYSVLFLEDEKEFNILEKFVSGKIAIISDKNILKFYPDFLDKFLSDKQVFHFTVNSGEKSKKEKTVFKILDFLSKNEFSKADTLIAFGGGVIGDIVGFTASIYLRGVSYIYIPTSLLSIVDSSIGGKTAINLKYGKNLCGTFYNPKAVLTFTEFLKTLPKKEMNNGLGEIIKYSFLSNNIVFDKIVDKDLILSCIKFKKEIVEKDEFDYNERKILNFGHTFAHAIEKASNYKLSHGESVFLGIYYSLIISKKISNLNDGSMLKYKEYGEYLEIKPQSFNKEKLFEFIKHDKKRANENIDFIILDKDGKPQIKKLSLEEIKGLI